MSPVTTRIFLGLSLILSIGAAVYSLSAVVNGQKEAWATLAACLAVITSMVSAWGAQRVVELEEDKRLPHPFPQFDPTSRYGLMLLKITNYGGGVAHNIQLFWDEPLKNSKEQEVGFSETMQNGGITLLMPNQSISRFIDGHIQFFQIQKNHVYRGRIEWRDAKGKKYKETFVLDAEILKGTLMYDDEALKTQYEVQQIPKNLTELKNEIAKVAKLLEQNLVQVDYKN